MKRLIYMLLCAALLAALVGCRQAEQQPVNPTPTQTDPPATTAEPTVDPTASFTNTTEPTPTPTLSPTAEPEEEPELVYSNENLGVALYTSENGTKTILRYGELTQEIADFPYNPLRPDLEVWQHDGDNDGKKELYIIHCWGSGTGISVDRLLVCEPNGDRLDYWIHDWTTIAAGFNADRTASYDENTGEITVAYADESRTLSAKPGKQYEDPAFINGDQISYFRNSDNTIGLSFQLAASSSLYPTPDFPGLSVEIALEFNGFGITEAGRPHLSGGRSNLPIDLSKEPDPDRHALSLAVPDFLTEEQQDLYRRANTLYRILFGGDTHAIDYFDQYGSYNFNNQQIELDGMTYQISEGRYAAWTDFDAVVHSLFTDRFWQSKNNWADNIPVFREYEGNLAFISAARGSGYYYNSNFSDLFELQSMTDEEIVFTLIGHYTPVWPKEGMSYEERDEYRAGTCEYIGKFTIRMVLTEEGWRFDEFHCALADELGEDDPSAVPYTIQAVSTLICSLPEENVHLYQGLDGNLYLQDGDLIGPVSYVNDINANHPGYYDLAKITIIRKELRHDWEGEPLYNVILLNVPFGDGASENPELWWVEESGTWDLAPFQSPGPLGNLMGEVTQDTIPTDPKQFYLVADSDEFCLYARNHGLESLLTWGGNFWWYLGERTAHTGHFNLPVMIPLQDDTVAVVSEVQTGTQTGVNELVVYQVTEAQNEDGSRYMSMTDYVYDWRPIAEEFNRNNTLVYDKDTNSLTLFRNGEVHFTGTLSNDLSAHLDLEDGFTGALIASGQIVHYEANEDSSFTITMQTCVGEGGNGYFSEDFSGDPFWYWNGSENYYYGMSVGITGLELSWTVNFTGEGFETSDVTVVQTGGESLYLKAAIPAESIYLYRNLSGGAGGSHYLLVDGEVFRLAGQDGFGDLIADFRLCDPDGDGEDEIAVVGNYYAGSGYTSVLNILDKTETGWGGCRFFPSDTYALMETAVFMPGADSNHMILSLAGFQFMFEVSDEVAARDGDYFASSTQLSTAITWDGEGYILHLPGLVYRNDSSIEGFYPSACDIYFELRCKLEYDGNGTITRVPVGITPPYTHFTVTQREENLFELTSEQGVVYFEGSHIAGEEIVTDRRDLDLDGVEEFIVLLVSGRSDSFIHQDAYIFDGRTLEQVDTSDLWTIGHSLFVFITDKEMFHIHCGTFRQPLYKKDILARYPDIEFLDKVEFWGNHSSLSVMVDYIEVSYDCIVGEGGESFGSLRVCLMVEDGQLVPFEIVYSSDSQYRTYPLAPKPVPGPFIGE